LPPNEFPLNGSAWLTLGICTLFFALTWLFARPRLAGDLGTPDSPGAAAALALALVFGGLALWVVNPFALCALLPALHLWFLVTASSEPPARPAALALVAGGLLLPLLVALGVLVRLSLNPLEGVWYGFLLVTGHHVGLYTTLLFAIFATCFAATVRIAISRR
jgi:hypothetical protein